MSKVQSLCLLWQVEGFRKRYILKFQCQEIMSGVVAQAVSFRAGILLNAF